MNGLATAAFFAFGALLVLFGTNASAIIGALDLDYADFGLVASMLSLGLGSGILLAGPLVDRLPRRPLFLSASACVAVASIAVGPGTGYSALLLSGFAMGFGAGFYETVLNSVIVEQSGPRAPRRLVLIHSAATFGAAATPFALGLLDGPLGLRWFDGFRAVGVLHLMLMGATRWIPSERPPTPDGPGRSETPRGRGRLLLAAICVATFAYVGVESALTFFVADHAHGTRGLALDRSAGVVGFFWTGMLLGRLALGLSRFEPGARATALLAGVAGIGIVAFFLGDLASPELAMGLAGLFLGGVFPTMIGLAGPTLPGAPGTAVALAAGCGSLGGFVVPWLTGALANRTGLATALATLGLWLLLLAAIAMGVQQRQRS